MDISRNVKPSSLSKGEGQASPAITVLAEGIGMYRNYAVKSAKLARGRFPTLKEFASDISSPEGYDNLKGRRYWMAGGVNIRRGGGYYMLDRHGRFREVSSLQYWNDVPPELRVYVRSIEQGHVVIEINSEDSDNRVGLIRGKEMIASVAVVIDGELLRRCEPTRTDEPLCNI